MSKFEVLKVEVFMQGVKAASEGRLKNPNDNPYTLGTKESFWWSNGFIKYQEFLVYFPTED